MQISREFIYENIATIPACHASTVLPLADGTVVCAWFAGTGEGKDDVGIYTSVRKNGVWAAPVRRDNVTNLPHWNPVLDENNGVIRLYFKEGKKIPHWITYYCESFDGGQTFTPQKELVEGDRTGGRGPVKNKILHTKNGLLLAPLSTEYRGWKCYADISSDGGNTWTKSKLITRPLNGKIPVGLIQPTFREVDGKIYALMRSNAGFIYSAVSSDGGYTWSKAQKTDMPNNNSGLDSVYANGKLYLVFNPVGDNWGERTPLRLSVSADNGKSWSVVADLENTPGEYSYPAITEKDGILHITYTYNRKKIAYVTVSELDFE